MVYYLLPLSIGYKQRHATKSHKTHGSQRIVGSSFNVVGYDLNINIK